MGAPPPAAARAVAAEGWWWWWWPRGTPPWGLRGCGGLSGGVTLRAGVGEQAMPLRLLGGVRGGGGGGNPGGRRDEQRAMEPPAFMRVHGGVPSVTEASEPLAAFEDCTRAPRTARFTPSKPNSPLSAQHTKNLPASVTTLSKVGTAGGLGLCAAVSDGAAAELPAELVMTLIVEGDPAGLLSPPRSFCHGRGRRGRWWWGCWGWSYCSGVTLAWARAPRPFAAVPRERP